MKIAGLCLVCGLALIVAVNLYPPERTIASLEAVAPAPIKDDCKKAETVIVQKEPKPDVLTQQTLGRIIVMTASAWDEWPKHPQCETFAERYKVVPCIGDFGLLIEEQPKVQPSIDPRWHTFPTEKEL